MYRLIIQKNKLIYKHLWRYVTRSRTPTNLHAGFAVPRPVRAEPGCAGVPAASESRIPRRYRNRMIPARQLGKGAVPAAHSMLDHGHTGRTEYSSGAQAASRRL